MNPAQQTITILDRGGISAKSLYSLTRGFVLKHQGPVLTINTAGIQLTRAGRDVHLAIVAQPPAGSGQHAITKTLSQTVINAIEDGYPIIDVRRTLPATGTAKQFPFDTYTAPVGYNLSLQLSAPPNRNLWFAVNGEGSILGAGGTLSLGSSAGNAVHIHGDPSIGDFEIDTASSGSIVSAGRAWSQQVFVLIVASSPLVLLGAGIVDGLRRRRTGQLNSSVISMELAAALVAVLPLRLVIVPSALSTLTLTDYLLALDLCAFIGAAALFTIARGKDSRLDRSLMTADGSSDQSRLVIIRDWRRTNGRRSVAERRNPIQNPDQDVAPPEDSGHAQ